MNAVIFCVLSQSLAFGLFQRPVVISHLDIHPLSVDGEKQPGWEPFTVDGTVKGSVKETA